MLSIYFYDASTTLIPKPDKHTTKRKLQTYLPLNIDSKILNKMLMKCIQDQIKTDYSPLLSWHHSRDAGMV